MRVHATGTIVLHQLLPVLRSMAFLDELMRNRTQIIASVSKERPKKGKTNDERK